MHGNRNQPDSIELATKASMHAHCTTSDDLDLMRPICHVYTPSSRILSLPFAQIQIDLVSMPIYLLFPPDYLVNTS